MTQAKLFFSKDEDRYHELLEMVVLRDDLSENIDKIRQKYGVLVNASVEDMTMRQLFWLPEDKTFQKDVSTMLKELKISQGWLRPVVVYILGTLYKEDATIATNPRGVTLQLDTTGKNAILLRLGPDATFPDVKEAWKIVKQLRGKSPRNKQRNNHARDLKILIMHKEGMSLAQICNAIKDEYGYTVKSNDEFDPGGFTQSYVRKIITEAYKRFGLDTPKLT